MRAALLAFALLAACAPTGTRSMLDASLDADSACTVEAARTWTPRRGARPMTIMAVARGPTCPQAVATLTIRTPENNILWSGAYPTAHVMTLADSHQTASSLREALLAWIDPATIDMRSTADLPEWSADRELLGGEFPFMPVDWMNRQSYNAMRAEAAPMFCFVQGMESINCLALRNGRIESVGIQMFPG